MNIVKPKLQKIFGDLLPENATSFYTVEHIAVFEVIDFSNRTETQYVEIDMTDNQRGQMQENNLLGSFGWSLQ